MALVATLLLLHGDDATAAAAHRRRRASVLTTAKEQRSPLSHAPPDYHHWPLKSAGNQKHPDALRIGAMHQRVKVRVIFPEKSITSAPITQITKLSGA